MAKRWNEGDVLRLTQDCELGKNGEILHVHVTSGAYMVARTLGSTRRTVRTGRDYAFASKVGTAPVDPDDADQPSIPPGAYRLDRDVKNPAADRRMTRDWSKAPVWTAGTEFVVREQQRMSRQDLEESLAKIPAEVADKLRARNTYTVIELAGDHHASIHRIGPGHAEQYAALAATLVPAEESLDLFLTRIDFSNSWSLTGFVRWLVESGAIQRADLERWWNRYKHGSDDDDEEVTKSDLARVTHHTDHETTLDEPAEEG